MNSGPFEGIEGAFEAVDSETGTVQVVVTIFGRPNPVDLKYWAVVSV